MGGQVSIFGGNKIFDPHFITAQITMPGKKVKFVPIKYMLGDYFLWENNKQVYAFIMTGDVYTSKVSGAKSFQTIYYDVSHYKPISPSDVKALEIIITKNSLPQLNIRLLNILRIFGKREKENTKTMNLAEMTEEFAPHDIGALIEELMKHEKRYQKEISEMLNFIASLDTKFIVTPVKRLADFIQQDLRQIDPKFMGTVFTQACKIEEKSQKVLNPTLTAKKSWVVMLLAIGLIITICTTLYFAYEAGAFDALSSSIPTLGGGADYSEKTLMSKYPTCPALKAALESGSLTYDKLPKSVQQVADSCQSVASP